MRRVIFAVLLLYLALASSAIAQTFFDDFESGLGKWPLNKSGAIVTDPLDPSNSVLTFQSANNTYDIKTGDMTLDPEATYVFRFRYLGLEGTGSLPGNLGGFIAIGSGTSHHAWDTTPCEVAYVGDLIDDGTWHSYELIFQLGEVNGCPLWPIHIIVEDWDGAASACPPNATVGDVFFDDLVMGPYDIVNDMPMTWAGVKALFFR